MSHTLAYHSPIALLPEDERRIFVEAQAKANRLPGKVSMAARISIWQLVDMQQRRTCGR